MNCFFLEAYESTCDKPTRYKTIAEHGIMPYEVLVTGSRFSGKQRSEAFTLDKRITRL